MGRRGVRGMAGAMLAVAGLAAIALPSAAQSSGGQSSGVQAPGSQPTARLSAAPASSNATAQSRMPFDRNFRASGSEPFWDLALDGTRMTFSHGDEEIVAVQPGVRRRGGTRRYVTPAMTVTISGGSCEDDALLTHVSTVGVLTREGSFDGCGGGILPPEDFEQTSWRILSIGGTDVSNQERYDLDFHDGRVSAQAGCNRMSGPYRRTAGQLRVTPITATEMACPAPHRAHEQIVMGVLSTDPRISFPDSPGYEPTVMVLTSAAGTIRLRRV